MFLFPCVMFAPRVGGKPSRLHFFVLCGLLCVRTCAKKLDQVQQHGIDDNSCVSQAAVENEGKETWHCERNLSCLPRQSDLAGFTSCRTALHCCHMLAVPEERKHNRKERKRHGGHTILLRHCSYILIVLRVVWIEAICSQGHKFINC